MTFILGPTSFHMQTAGASVMESVVPCSHENALLIQTALYYDLLNPLVFGTFTVNHRQQWKESLPIAGSCLFGNFLCLFR